MPSAQRQLPATIRVALVTHEGAPALTEDDGVLGAALASRGAGVEALPWTAQVDWGRFDVVLLRSAWDYHLRCDSFLRWIDEVEGSGATVINAPAMIRWNADKRYLLELGSAGVEIVPTEVVERAEAPSAGGPGVRNEPRLRETLAALLERRGWDDAVVKPVVSASAHETWRTSLAAAAADESRFRRLVATSARGMLVQQFMPEVLDEGEWSLVFIDGRFSHAACKRPRPGDFRVQHEHGGSYAPAVAPSAVVADARRALLAGASCAGVPPHELAYARVDGIVREHDGAARLVLMELECIEPNLFFLHAPDAAERLADGVVRRVLEHRERAGQALANPAPAPYLR